LTKGKETIKETVDRLANIEVPKLLEQILGDKTLGVETKAACGNDALIAQRHLRYLQARLG